MGENLILIYLIRKVGSLIPGCSSLHPKSSFCTYWTSASSGAFIEVWMLEAFSQRDMLSKALYENQFIYHRVFSHAWMIIFSSYVSQNTRLGCHNAFITHKDSIKRHHRSGENDMSAATHQDRAIGMPEAGWTTTQSCLGDWVRPPPPIQQQVWAALTE